MTRLRTGGNLLTNGVRGIAVMIAFRCGQLKGHHDFDDIRNFNLNPER
jgi:hypothetical protein